MSVSELVKRKLDKDEEPKKRSREEWKKEKELEEARKAGTMPALVDESGKDINPHIPQYIASAPWYYGASKPTLKHQRPQNEKRNFSKIEDYYVRGQKSTHATKFRDGACTNCGAMGHAKKDCFERPRKVGAKYAGKVFAADDVELKKLELDYDGKRDRWNGFHPSMYKAVLDEFEEIEKKKLEEQRLKNTTESKNGEQVESESESDEDERYAEKIDMPGTKVDSKQRITVRNLRIREDTAKYLRNLDPDSAYYDPKTRSMRENPYKHTGKSPAELPYAGENFVRYTGDTTKVSKMQLFAWEAHEKGVDLHLQAEPTKAELLHKEYQVKKYEIKNSIKSAILEKYGGEEHLKASPKELIFSQTENYVEYSRDGSIITGAPPRAVKSIYEEDVYHNNHTSVWGSYWEDGQWGYKCCRSLIKNSYCLGKKEESKNK